MSTTSRPANPTPRCCCPAFRLRTLLLLVGLGLGGLVHQGVLMGAADERGLAGAPPLSPDDAAARTEMLTLAGTRLTRECQANCVVRIPAVPSGLPKAYAVRLYIEGYNGRVIEIRCQENRVTGEMVTAKAFLRGDLPRTEVDRRTREFLYLYRAQLSRKDGTGVEQDRQTGYASGAPDVTIAIRAAAEETTGRETLLIETPSLQWYASSIDEQEGPRPFAIAWFAAKICALCKAELPDQADRPEVLAEIVTRLKALPPSEPRGSSAPRDDRISVPVRVYADLLLRHKVSMRDS